MTKQGQDYVKKFRKPTLINTELRLQKATSLHNLLVCINRIM